LDIGLTISIFYFLFCLYTNENILREILLKLFPAFIVDYYMKIFIIIKKNSFILILILLLLSLFAKYLAYHYLGFFIDNIDKIIEVYFK
jgi:hypothetical protein